MKAIATPLTFNDFSGQVIYPGLYTADAAMLNTGTLYLSVLNGDGGSVVTDPTWSFYLGGAFTNGAASTIVFVGALDDVDGDPTVLFDPAVQFATSPPEDRTPDKFDYTTVLNTVEAPLQWNIVGAATLAVDSYMIGDVKSNGAITVGASATCGNLEALGAITLGPGSAVGTVRATGALTTALTGKVGPAYDAAEQATTVVVAAISACEALVEAAKLALLGLSS